MMLRFIIGTIANAFGLWVAASLIPAVALNPYGGEGFWPELGSYLLVAALFGLVSSILGPVIKIVALPLYIITFGLISFVINGAMLLLVAWLSQLLGGDLLTIDGVTSAGLAIESLAWATLAAIVISISATIARGVLKLLRLGES
jgi:putative membrane protein